MDIIVGPTPHDTAELAARWMARRIRSAVRLRDLCRVAVSGGGTPALMLDAMATMDLPWKRVHLYQVDERVAPDGDVDRNATQLIEHLIERIEIPRRNVHLMPVTAVSLKRACTSYATALGDSPLDIVHLGIGDDGHTASWPPGDPVIEVTAPVAMSDLYNGRIRMTLTPGVVNAARARMMLSVGVTKSGPLADWMLHRADLPVQRVRRTGTTLILDQAAASQLQYG